MCRQSREDVLEVGVRIVPVQVCGLDQAHDRRRTFARMQRAGEQPIRSAQGNCRVILPISAQRVEVHYRWHALYGRRFHRQYSEQRATGVVVHVKNDLGMAMALPAWMLDAGTVCR